MVFSKYALMAGGKALRSRNSALNREGWTLKALDREKALSELSGGGGVWAPIQGLNDVGPNSDDQIFISLNCLITATIRTENWSCQNGLLAWKERRREGTLQFQGHFGRASLETWIQYGQSVLCFKSLFWMYLFMAAVFFFFFFFVSTLNHWIFGSTIPSIRVSPLFSEFNCEIYPN